MSVLLIRISPEPSRGLGTWVGVKSLFWVKEMKARRIDFSTSLLIIFTRWYFLFYTNMIFCTSLIIFLPQINPVFSHLHPWVHVILASWHTLPSDTSHSRQVFFPHRGLHGFFPAGSWTSSLWPYVYCAAFSQSSFPAAYVDVFSRLFFQSSCKHFEDRKLFFIT